MGKVLSRSTAAQINWSELNKKANELFPPHMAAGDPCADVKKIPERALVEEVFKAYKDEFKRVLDQLKRPVGVYLWVMLTGLAVVIIVFAFVLVLNDPSRWYGPVVGGAGGLGAMGAIAKLAVRAWHLGKDQALLELIPAHYEAMFKLAPSPQQYCRIYHQFQSEMAQLRRRLRQRGAP